MIHDESKALLWDVLLKAFSCISVVEVLYRTHTGEKPFDCYISCKKYFSRNSLNKHMKVYDEPKEK